MIFYLCVNYQRCHAISEKLNNFTSKTFNNPMFSRYFGGFLCNSRVMTLMYDSTVSQFGENLLSIELKVNEVTLNFGSTWNGVHRPKNVFLRQNQ